MKLEAPTKKQRLTASRSGASSKGGRSLGDSEVETIGSFGSAKKLSPGQHVSSPDDSPYHE